MSCKELFFQIAVCNLASLALPMYVTSEGNFDFEKLFEVTKVVAVNLNKIIDINYYPVLQVNAIKESIIRNWKCFHTVFILKHHVLKKMSLFLQKCPNFLSNVLALFLATYNDYLHKRLFISFFT